MPRTLFDQTLAPRRRNRRSLGTVTLSVMLHAAALVVVLALQFTSSVQSLVVASPLPVFVAPTATLPPVVTPPPAVQRVAAPTPNINTAPTAPTVAPDHLSVEPVSLPTAGPPAPTGPVVGTPGIGDMSPFKAGSQISIAPPPPQKPVRVGGTILAPARQVYVPPVYPTVAQSARIEGEVVLEATIDEKGAVRNVVVQESVPLLDRAAIEAVSRWRYSPTLLNGQPVAVIMLVRVRFTLK
jgi:protein TonB